MAKVDYPAHYDSEEQWQDHLAALGNELTLLRARGNPRAKEVEEQIKLSGGTVPAKRGRPAKADAEDGEE